MQRNLLLGIKDAEEEAAATIAPHDAVPPEEPELESGSGVAEAAEQNRKHFGPKIMSLMKPRAEQKVVALKPLKKIPSKAPAKSKANALKDLFGSKTGIA